MHICLGKNVQRDYVIKLKENIFVEEDLSKNCVNYPHGKYESYKACDDAFLISALPPGLVPIWSVDTMENVTTKLYIEELPNTPYDYEDLHDGTQISPCLLPCSTISIESRLLAEKMSRGNFSTISLTFSQSISVTTTDFLKFAFVNILSDLGGCLGLWLGLGLVQTIEIVMKIILPRIRSKN